MVLLLLSVTGPSAEQSGLSVGGTVLCLAGLGGSEISDGGIFFRIQFLKLYCRINLFVSLLRTLVACILLLPL